MSEGISGTSLPGAAAVIWAPVRTLRRVSEERRAPSGLAMVALNAVLGLIFSGAFVLGGATRRSVGRQFAQPGIPPGSRETVARVAEAGALALAALSPFVVWLVVSLLMHLATRGAGPLSSMLGVVGVAQAPLVVGGVLGAVLSGLRLLADARTPVGAVLDYLVSLVSFGFSLWYVVLVVIGAAPARNIGYGESAGSYALS